MPPEKEPDQYGFAAIHAAKRIVTENHETSLAAYAQAFLFRLSFRDVGASQALITSMARFACAYPDSDHPIQLYRQLSNELTTQGNGGAALAMLSHGIRHCQAHRDGRAAEETALRNDAYDQYPGSNRVCTWPRAKLDGRNKSVEGVHETGQAIEIRKAVELHHLMWFSTIANDIPRTTIL